MKKIQLLLLMFLLSSFYNYAQNFKDAQWIWLQENETPNSWVSFRKTVEINHVPEKVFANIAVDSRFWLWINGEMVVFEGGSSRGPSQAGDWNRKEKITPTNTWYEEVDIQKYLKKGKNTIAVLAWYWGRETHKGTYIDSGKGGLLFETILGETKIVSNNNWKVKQHPAYSIDVPDIGNSVVQYPIKYDARKDLKDWSDIAWYTENYNDNDWVYASEKGKVPTAPWYNLEKNYTEPLVNHGLKNYENHNELNFPFVSDGKTIICKLPFNKQITPYFEIEGNAGEIIQITTDNRLNKITANYTTKQGNQKFESFSWMNGHTINYTIPKGVKIKALKYRWMSVGEMAGSFESSDAFYERLWWMGRNTLFVCARDNYMDCPDRERALWIGDVADQTGYIFYSMDNAGSLLLKKAILNTVYFSQDKVFGALGPLRVRELPSQSLQFIAQTIWPYYFNTGDLETLKKANPYVFDYLSLFEMKANGLPKYRVRESPDSWDWNDWGVKETIDKEPIQTAFYYMALKSAKKIAIELGETEKVSWYENRMKSIKNSFDKEYWKNGFYSTDITKFKDDRANALAILSGLANPINYDKIIKNVLIPNKFSSPHFEWMVEEAMCVAGDYKASLDRMKEQYQTQVHQKNLTTLYEMFPRGGSYNHAWNASNTVLSKYITGVEPTKVGWSQFQVCPNLAGITSISHTIPSVKGEIKVAILQENKTYKLALESPKETSTIVGIPKSKMNISEIKLNDTYIWRNGKFLNNFSGLTFLEENSKYIKFEIISGKWNFEAK
jgi:hypothetical protein